MAREDKATITLAVGEAPYGRERLYTALRFVLASLVGGHSVNLFLFEDAVFAAKKGQNPPELPSLLEHEAMPNCGQLLGAAVSYGASVKLCGVCATERGLSQEELIDGVTLGTIHDLVDWVVGADKAVFL